MDGGSKSPECDACGGVCAPFVYGSDERVAIERGAGCSDGCCRWKLGCEKDVVSKMKMYWKGWRMMGWKGRTYVALGRSGCVEDGGARVGKNTPVPNHFDVRRHGRREGSRRSSHYLPWKRGVGPCVARDSRLGESPILTIRADGGREVDRGSCAGYVGSGSAGAFHRHGGYAESGGVSRDCLGLDG